MNNNAEELGIIETLNLIELYEKLQTLAEETYDCVPDEIQKDLDTAKNGIKLYIHIGVLHNEIGFQHKEKYGQVIYRGKPT